jgi:hypothetical protein
MGNKSNSNGRMTPDWPIKQRWVKRELYSPSGQAILSRASYTCRPGIGCMLPCEQHHPQPVIFTTTPAVARNEDGHQGCLSWDADPAPQARPVYV